MSEIKESNINAKSIFVPTSRYYNSEIVYYGENNKITLKTYNRHRITISDTDKYTILEPKYEYRPDKLSYEVYGTPDFWWKILEDNNIFDIYDFVAGINIRIPGISVINEL